jgi:hypothetical protein
MSYCHQVSGGYSNIAMTFGGTAAVPHTCGSSPMRVPNRMKAHVASVAAANPTCITTTATCGNGVIEGTETCDGINFGVKTCAAYGFSTGALACINCQISTANWASTPACKISGVTCTASTECCSANCRKVGKSGAKNCA